MYVCTVACCMCYGWVGAVVNYVLTSWSRVTPMFWQGGARCCLCNGWLVTGDAYVMGGWSRVTPVLKLVACVVALVMGGW